MDVPISAEHRKKVKVAVWAIAFKTLLADVGKLMMALAGVAFSVVLMNIQGGLYLGLIRKAGLLVDHSQADIWVGHSKMNNVDFPIDVPRQWIDRIRATPGVAHVEPYLIGYSKMALPDGGYEYVLIVGYEPSGELGGAWNLIAGSQGDIHRTDGIIVDDCDAQKLHHPQLGELREIDGKRARVVGFTHGIQGFSLTPYVFTSFNSAAQFLQKPMNATSYFLVQIKPGAEAAQVCQEIRRRIPTAEVLTNEQYANVSVDYWLKRTGIGISFGASTLLGLLVGLLIVGQTLYTSALDRMSEFAALKAIGATESQLFAIVFGQAIALSTLGAFCGLAVVGVVGMTLSTPIAPIVIPWWISLGSCIAVTAICMIASLLPYVRIRCIEPAIVLQR